MADLSHLDNLYFVDEYVFNCPYCNRNNVPYEVEGNFQFDWSKEKECYGYLVKCRSCHNTSMHLSFMEIELYRGYDNNRFNLGDIKDIDSLFFHSVPSSRFVLDERIPGNIRELMIEADGSLKMNFLMGAGACLRSAVNELMLVDRAEGEKYLDRVESLRAKHPEVDSLHFEILARIDDMAVGEKVYEQSWDMWETKYLKLIMETMRALLNEIFILPSLKKDKKKEIEALLEDIKKDENELVDLDLDRLKR
ncbi:MAG: hypothetical protein IME98_01660 [Proteobacteria bacterium]|nr:hypothetical protein [Pseudomonadota bacterium]